MHSFENVSFADKLPEEASDFEFDKLLNLKNEIDVKIKALESKINMRTFMSEIEKKETELPHIRANVYFSFKHQF